MGTPASYLRVGVAALPPLGAGCGRNQRPIDDHLSFQLDLSDDIRTLSTYHDRRGDFEGAFYVPELPSDDDECARETENLILPNVTRIGDLPSGSCHLLALAPWTSTPRCTRRFLTAASADSAYAAVFYLPDDPAPAPPPPESTTWDLGDRGAWKTENRYPVYAIPGHYGRELMQKLAQYSDRLPNAPFGDQLEQMYPADTRIRVFGSFSLEDDPNSVLPNLWIFMLVLLAILVSGVLTSALITRFIQFRRRMSLQRRIASGEVDLEMLHVKRLNVPQNVLNKMPMYTYYRDGERPEEVLDPNGPSSAGASSPDGPAPAQTESAAGTAAKPQTARSGSSEPPPEHSYSQPTCPICLEDYVSGQSTVRELPCRHIYHPECIDSFLLENSSLCPVCKTSALPRGYCPDVITDTMVRQERVARRLALLHQAREPRQGSNQGPLARRNDELLAPPIQRILTRIGQRRARNRGLLLVPLPPRIPSSTTAANTTNAPAITAPSTTAPAATGTPNTTQLNPTTPTTPATPAGTSNRQEEMRRRALAMLREDGIAVDESPEEPRSRGRRVLHFLFPTLR